MDLLLEKSAEEFRARYGLPTVLQRISPLGDRWDESALHEIGRMVQEGLTNVARHAGATTVLLRWVAVGPLVKIQVEDDGLGLQGPEGLGMHGVRERAELLGGTAQWDTLATGGTRMTLTLPIPERTL